MSYSAFDASRRVVEYGKNPVRTDFERDRARVLHSSALRRLGAKTQVMGPGSDDFIRTRLTHSLEVAQVGRELGKVLGCDPDVVDTACLAHDLGHPPFGHNGERALAEACTEIGGFEGNAQTLRLLTLLEPKVIFAGRSHGLNLTRASLDAAIKYPWGLATAPLRPAGFPKFGYYEADAETFAWIRQGAPGRRRCIEAQVMDLADDIAYSVHDIEDAIVSGRFDFTAFDQDRDRAQIIAVTREWYGEQVSADELDAALDRIATVPFIVRNFAGSREDLARLKDMTSELIGRFSSAARAATREKAGSGPLRRYAAELVVPAQITNEILVLKGAAAAFVMAPREREPIYTQQRRIVHDLVDIFTARAPACLEPSFAADWCTAADETARGRAVIDQIASLTDISAMRLHAQLTGTGQ